MHTVQKLHRSLRLLCSRLLLPAHPDQYSITPGHARGTAQQTIRSMEHSRGHNTSSSREHNSEQLPCCTSCPYRTITVKHQQFFRHDCSSLEGSGPQTSAVNSIRERVLSVIMLHEAESSSMTQELLFSSFQPSSPAMRTTFVSNVEEQRSISTDTCLEVVSLSHNAGEGTCVRTLFNSIRNEV